jgi:tungstate transport system ATP-binding protein
VTLAIPDGTSKTSARNTFRGRIGRIVPLGLVHRVEIACGFPLVAFVTAHALEDLSLKEGDEVAASVKATAIHVIRKGGG